MARDAPTAVLQAALKNIVGGLEKQTPEELKDFIASAVFTGGKSGYYFSKGDKGVG